MWVVYALHIQVAGSVATSVFSSFVLVVLLTVHELVCYEIECEKNVKRYQMKTIVSFLLLSLVFPVDVFSEPPPYFDSKPLDNNSYVNVHLVGGHDSGNNSVQCRTDLGTCCSIRQGNYRADWYFPNGTKLNFMESGDDIFESRGAQRVDLRRRENAVSLTGGMYRCDIPTARNGHRSIYVGLYPSSGGKVKVEKLVRFDPDKLTLTCISIGGPATTVTWTRDSTNVEGYVTVLNDASTAKYTHTLSVTKPGMYRCKVSNNKPSSASSDYITLTETKPPNKVAASAVPTTQTSIHVSWNPSSDATGYRIHYNSTRGDSSTEIIAGGSTQSFTLSNLQSGYNYTIFVVATSGNLPSEMIRAPEDVTLGCPDGLDKVWDIVWSITAAQTNSTQTCPHATGNATRECSLTGSWGVTNVMSCLSEEIALVQEEAICLYDAETHEERIQCAVNISVQLAEASLAVSTKRGPNTSIYPLDLQTINGIVPLVLNVFEKDERREVLSSEALVDVFNNVLREANQAGWTQLQTAGSGSQTLLQNAERFGRILGTSTVNGNGTLVLSRENIVIAAEVVKRRVSNFSFPAQPDQLGNFSRDNNETVRVTIPEDSLKRLTEEAEVYLVNTIFRNIEDFLPTNTSVLSNGQTESLVISTQFGALDREDFPNDTFKDSPITFNFSFRASSDTGSKYAGVFWDFSNPVNNGRWSSKGIQVISSVTRDNVTTVVFNSTHLTSFAVLVDVAGGLEGTSKEETLALKIFSYIGCAISTVCLFITVLFYLAMGKKLFSAIHYFVHLNLAISLLLGYLVFVLGIELGNSNKVACGFVAALLQYLFLSAFCWMMCEGIMLYLMLIVVFSRLSKKWWFFMIIGYCTPLLFVASGLAARVEHYGVYGDDGELAFCWLSTKQGTIFAFVAPMILIIIVNTVFLVLSVMALLHSNQKAGVLGKRKSLHKAKTILKATVILLPLLGVTWLFGLLTLNSSTTVFAWLFTIFNSLQGGAIFFFHVVRSKLVWNKIMFVFKKTVPVSSTNNTFSNTSESQSSAEILKSVLHKKPLDLRENGEAEPYASYSAMSVSGPPSDAELENDSLKGDNNEADITQDLAECNGTAGQ